MTARVHLDRHGRSRCGCGTPGTTDPAAVTCVSCQTLMAGMLPGGIAPGGKSGALRHDVKPHGTPAAARRHYRHGERLCESCNQAEARRQADRRNRKDLAA